MGGKRGRKIRDPQPDWEAQNDYRDTRCTTSFRHVLSFAVTYLYMNSPPVSPQTSQNASAPDTFWLSLMDSHSGHSVDTSKHPSAHVEKPSLKKQSIVSWHHKIYAFLIPRWTVLATFRNSWTRDQMSCVFATQEIWPLLRRLTKYSKKFPGLVPFGRAGGK